MCIRVDDDGTLRSMNVAPVERRVFATDRHWTAAVEHARSSVGATAAILSPAPDGALVRAGIWPHSAAAFGRAIEALVGPIDGIGAIGIRTSWGPSPCSVVLELQQRFRLRRLAVLYWAIGPARWGWIALIDTSAESSPPMVAAHLRTLACTLRERCLVHQQLLEAVQLTERLEDVARAAGDWIWETDEQHRYTWVHDSLPFPLHQGLKPPRVGERIPAGVVVNGFGEAELPRRDLHDVLDDGAPFVRRVVKEIDADGGVRFVSRSAVPLRRADGSFRGYRGSARDVTQSLDAKARMWRRDEMLRRAKEQAEASSQAKSVLVSKVGHELRTPLNAIVGLAQLIQARADSGDNARVDGWIEQIARTGWHMVDVLDLLMELGRVGADQAPAIRQPVNVVDAVRDAMRFVERDALERGIGIHLESETDVRAAGDRRAVCQVVVNLLSNAIKYNRAGGLVHVWVSQAEHARIEIRDTGHGLSEEQISRLFTPFERLGVKDSEVQGHGLGLLICKELVGSMGGTLQVRSSVGQGTTFSVLLPLADTGPALAPERLPDASGLAPALAGSTDA